MSEQFTRASQYHPEWMLANASGGTNSLWLTEKLAPALPMPAPRSNELLVRYRPRDSVAEEFP